MNAPDREKALELALAQIEKHHGKGSVMRLGDDTRPPIEVIPTGSIALDVALGIGGLPRGRVVEIYGPESSGKTTVALHAVANAQAAGGIAAFIDAEHALDPEYAKALGVDTDALLVSQPDTGEQALEIADMLIRSGALDIIVIDSVAALVPRAEIEGEMGDSHVGLQARLMSQALRKITGALSNSGTTAIFINQLREKIGVMFGCFHYWHPGHARRRHAGEDRQDRQPEDAGRGALLRPGARHRSCPKQGRQLVRQRPDRPVPAVHRRPVRAATAGRSSPLTANHLVRTPGGWREAGELIAGDRVMLAQTAPARASSSGRSCSAALMGDGNLSPSRIAGSLGSPVPDGARREAGRVPRLEGVAARQHRAVPLGRNAKGAVFVDFTPLPELAELRRGGLPRRRQEAPHLGLPQGAHAAGAGDLVHGRRLLHGPVEGPAGAHRGRQRPDRDLCRGDEPGLARAARRAISRDTFGLRRRRSTPAGRAADGGARPSPRTRRRSCTS